MTGADFIQEQTGWRCPYCQRLFEFVDQDRDEPPEICIFCGYDPTFAANHDLKALIWALETVAQWMKSTQKRLLLVNKVEELARTLRYTEGIGKKEIKVMLVEG